MATTTFSADGSSLTLAFSAEEQTKAARCRTAYGDAAFGVTVVNWLDERQRHLDERDAKTLKANADSLTAAEKAQIPSPIRTKLGL